MLPEMSCENRHLRNSKHDETALSEDKLGTVLKERLDVDNSIFIWHFVVAAALVVFWQTDIYREKKGKIIQVNQIVLPL